MIKCAGTCMTTAQKEYFLHVIRPSLMEAIFSNIDDSDLLSTDATTVHDYDITRFPRVRHDRVPPSLPPQAQLKISVRQSVPSCHEASEHTLTPAESTSAATVQSCAVELRALARSALSQAANISAVVTAVRAAEVRIEIGYVGVTPQAAYSACKARPAPCRASRGSGTPRRWCRSTPRARARSRCARRLAGRAPAARVAVSGRAAA